MIFLTLLQVFSSEKMLTTLRWSAPFNLKRTQTNLERTAQTINSKIVKCNLPRNQKLIFYTPQKFLSALIEGLFDHQLRYPSLEAKIILIFFFQTTGVIVRAEISLLVIWEKENSIFIFCQLHSQYSQ